jgi:hypothetical protein
MRFFSTKKIGRRESNDCVLDRTRRGKIKEGGIKQKTDGQIKIRSGWGEEGDEK